MNRQFLQVISFAAIFSLIAIYTFGQDEEEITPFVFDSVPFEKPSLKFITDLKALRAEIIEPISSPSGYIIRTRPEKFRSVISIALTVKNGFKVFEIHDDGGDEIHATRINFDNKGNKELILKYSHRNGMSGSSGGYHGWSEFTKGFSIWSLDKIVLLAKFETYFSHIEWWETFDPAEPDSLENEKRTIVDSGAEKSCYNYEYNIKVGLIVFKEVSVCNDNEEQIRNPIDKPRVIKYKLGKTSIFRVR